MVVQGVICIIGGRRFISARRCRVNGCGNVSPITEKTGEGHHQMSEGQARGGKVGGFVLN